MPREGARTYPNIRTMLIRIQHDDSKRQDEHGILCFDVHYTSPKVNSASR